jgi:hypothetical protein
MHKFSCSGGTSTDSRKIMSGQVTPKVCFCIRWDLLTGTHYVELEFLQPVGYAGHIVHFGAFEVQNVDVLFFMLEWDRYGFHKKRTGTRYAELEFLHPVGSVGHRVHSSACGAQNIDVLFFMPGWDRFRFHKKRARTHYDELLFLHPVGSAGHVVHSSASGRETSMYYFSCFGGTDSASTKTVLGHVMMNL